MTAMIRGFDESLRDMIRAIGPNIITIQRVGSPELRQRRRVRRDAEAAEPDGLRRARDRGAGADDPARGHPARAPGWRRRRRSASSTATCGRGRSSSSARPRTSRTGTQLGAQRRAVLQRHRSAVPEERRRARTDAVSGAVRADRHRPDRQDRPRRRRALHGRRRLRQAARRRRVQRRPGRLRRHPVHRAISGSSACAASTSAAAARRSTFVPIQIAAGAARRRRRRRTPSPTSSA